LVSVPLIGQKAKMKGQKVKAHYLQLPQTGFSKDITIYSVDVNSENNSIKTLGYTNTDVANSFKIGSYSRIEEPLGAKVVVDITGPSGSPLKLNTKKKENKKGEKWNEYSYTVKFEGSMLVKVLDKDGSLLFEDIVSESKSETTTAHRSKAALKKAFDSSKFYKSNRSKILKSLLSSGNLLVNRQFGFVPKSENIKFDRLANKKHPDYAAWKKHEATVESAFKSLTASDNSTFKEKIAPAMTFWKDKEVGYSYKDKEGKKLKHSALKNLFLASLYTEDYDGALAYAKSIVASKHEEKDGKKMVEKVTNLKSQLEKLDRTSRFFKIEMAEDIAEQKKAFKEERESQIAMGDLTVHPEFDDKVNLRSNSTVLAGTNYPKGGNAISGFWVFEKDIDGIPDFREMEKIRFAYDSNGELKVGTPNPAKIDSMIIDDRSYRVESVKLGSGIAALKVKNAIITDVKEYKNTTVVMVIPPFKKGRAFGQTSEMEPEIAIYKKADQVYYATNSLTGVNKAMKKIVKGCSVAEEYLDNLKAEKKKKSLLSRLTSTEGNEVIYNTLELFDECEE